MQVSFSPHPLQQLWGDLLIFILIGARWNIKINIITLIYIFLFSRDNDHFFQFFFPNYFLFCESSLYILDINPPSNIEMPNILSYSVNFLVT